VTVTRNFLGKKTELGRLDIIDLEEYHIQGYNSVISQKAELFITTAVRTSNLT
jgi:hypothetical protein